MTTCHCHPTSHFSGSPTAPVLPRTPSSTPLRTTLTALDGGCSAFHTHHCRRQNRPHDGFRHTGTISAKVSGCGVVPTPLHLAACRFGPGGHLRTSRVYRLGMLAKPGMVDSILIRFIFFLDWSLTQTLARCRVSLVAFHFVLLGKHCAMVESVLAPLSSCRAVTPPRPDPSRHTCIRNGSRARVVGGRQFFFFSRCEHHRTSELLLIAVQAKRASEGTYFHAPHMKISRWKVSGPPARARRVLIRVVRRKHHGLTLTFAQLLVPCRVSGVPCSSDSMP